jgi:hypothetical protein
MPIVPGSREGFRNRFRPQGRPDAEFVNPTAYIRAYPVFGLPSARGQNRST